MSPKHSKNESLATPPDKRRRKSTTSNEDSKELPFDIKEYLSDSAGFNVDPLSEGGPRAPIHCNCKKWTGFKLLRDDRFIAQVYLFDFETICTYIPDLKTDIKTKNLPKDHKVILKVYDVSLTSIRYENDIEDSEIDPDVTFEDYEEEWEKYYFNEIESYRRIIKYNNSHGIVNGRINVPEIYRCGFMTVISDNKGFEFKGRFILMEYIDSKPEFLSDDALERGIDSLKKIGMLGIFHFDIVPRNVLIKDGQMVIIDFSHASVWDSSHENSGDWEALEEVWKHLRPKVDDKKDNEHQA